MISIYGTSFPFPKSLNFPQDFYKRPSTAVLGTSVVAAFLVIGFYSLRFINNQTSRLIKAYLIEPKYDDKAQILLTARLSMLVFGAILSLRSALTFLDSIKEGAYLALIAQACFSIFFKTLTQNDSASNSAETESEKILLQAHQILQGLGFENLHKEAKKMSLEHSFPRRDVIDAITKHLVARQPFCLVAKPGSGKTHAIIEFLLLLHHWNGSESLFNKLKNELIVYKTTVSQLESNTTYVGSFSTKFNEINKAARHLRSIGKQLVLYIDEIHMLYDTGGGNNETRSINGMNQLKPLIESVGSEPPLVILISATTDDEYWACVSKDKAFKRRLGRPVELPPPSAEEFLQILSAHQRGLFSKAEDYLGKEALEGKTKLSNDQLNKIISQSKNLPLGTAHLDQAMQVLNAVLRVYLYSGVSLFQGREDSLPLDEIINLSLRAFSEPIGAGD